MTLWKLTANITGTAKLRLLNGAIRQRPFGTQKMKETYLQRLSSTRAAVLDCCRIGEAGKYVCITRINVPIEHRGQGIGTNLLQQVCDDADYEEKDLILEIVPSGSLNYDQLEAWYAGFGFERIEYGEWQGFYLREYDGKDRSEVVQSRAGFAGRKA